MLKIILFKLIHIKIILNYIPYLNISKIFKNIKLVSLKDGTLNNNYTNKINNLSDHKHKDNLKVDHLDLELSMIPKI